MSFYISPLPPFVRLAASFFAAGVGARVEHIGKETFLFVEVACIGNMLRLDGSFTVSLLYQLS